MVCLIDTSRPDWQRRMSSMIDSMRDIDDSIGCNATKIAMLLLLMSVYAVMTRRAEKNRAEKNLVNRFKLVLARETLRGITECETTDKRFDEEVETRSPSLKSLKCNRVDNEESDDARTKMRTRLRSLTNDDTKLKLVEDKREGVWSRIIQTLLGLIQDWIQKAWQVVSTQRRC